MKLKFKLYLTGHTFRIKSSEGAARYFQKQARGSHKMKKQSQTVFLSEVTLIGGLSVPWVHLFGH